MDNMNLNNGYPAPQTYMLPPARREGNVIGTALLIHAGISLLIGSIYTSAVSSMAMDGYSTGLIAAQALGFALFPTIAALVAILYGTAAMKTTVTDVIRFKNFPVRYTLIAAAAAWGAQSLVVWLTFLLGLFGVSLSMPDTLTDTLMTSPAGAVPFSLYLCVLAPIFEELLLRGFALKILSRINTRAAIIVTSVMFGLIHGNITQFLFATALGIILATLTVKCGSVIPAIAVHMFVNTTNTLISLWSYNVNAEAADTFAVIWYIIGAVIGTAAIIYMLIKRRKLTPQEKSECNAAISGFAGSGTIIGVGVLYIIMILLMATVSIISGYAGLTG